ncbi:hypothetical protein SAMN06265182_1522 [Persephonella hydrogeniphila]|uniref:Lipoprotein n=1 Tax=Persephonella hydrogeniphila TaxID=198703 RepID=A0A285NKD8_9AQUI|nr:hypothetical protein [Persephonella hydrogeniphila]SNZ09427.1 hypothetical protein SAMN06265182_1522 [Persephonella hydrogeniphila]
MKFLWIITAVLFITGCENFYEKVYDEKIKIEKIPCLNVEEKNAILRAQIIRVLKKENIKFRDNCPYTLKVNAKFLSQCNNPEAKSIGADFDGFLRFDLYRKGELVYRCQMDWKGEFSEEKIEDLVRKMKKDLKGL